MHLNDKFIRDLRMFMSFKSVNRARGNLCRQDRESVRVSLHITATYERPAASTMGNNGL